MHHPSATLLTRRDPARFPQCKHVRGGKAEHHRENCQWKHFCFCEVEDDVVCMEAAEYEGCSCWVLPIVWRFEHCGCHCEFEAKKVHYHLALGEDDDQFFDSFIIGFLRQGESKCVPWCRNLSGKVFHVVWGCVSNVACIGALLNVNVVSCGFMWAKNDTWQVCLFVQRCESWSRKHASDSEHWCTWCILMLPNETRIPWCIFKELKLCVLETVFERKRWGELIIHTVECFRFTWRSEGECDGECGVPIFRLLFPYRWFFFSCMFWSASFRGRDRFGCSRGDAQQEC